MKEIFNTKKGPVLILLMFVVILLGIIIYLFSQNTQLKYNNQQSTTVTTSSSFVEYKHPSELFSINYPVGWEVHETANNVVVFYPPLNGDIEPRQQLKVAFYNLGKNDLESFILGGGVGNYASYFSKPDSLVLDITNEIPKYRVYKPSDWPSIGLSQTRFIVDGTKLLYVNFDPMEKDSDQLFSQILSTVTFAD